MVLAAGGEVTVDAAPAEEVVAFESEAGAGDDDGNSSRGLKRRLKKCDSW